MKHLAIEVLHTHHWMGYPQFMVILPPNYLVHVPRILTSSSGPEIQNISILIDDPYVKLLMECNAVCMRSA